MASESSNSDGSTSDNNDNIDNDLSLQLTPLECQYALELKEVVTGTDECPNQSDFEYAQFALLTQGNVEKALFRMKGLQDFRDEYNITTDPSKRVQEGMQLLRAFIKQHPGFLLHVDCKPTQSTIVANFSKFQPKTIRLPEEWRVCLGGLYYLYQTLQPTFHAVREGMDAICEFQDYGWNNFSVDFHRQSYHHFHQFYPMKTRSATWFHASVVATLLHSFLKTLRLELAYKVQLESGDGLLLEEGRLDELFLGPNPERSEARLLQTLCVGLIQRYENQERFVLPSQLPADTSDP